MNEEEVCTTCGQMHWSAYVKLPADERAKTSACPGHANFKTMKNIFAVGEEVTIWNLRPGAIFVTRDGCYAVKSEYTYPNGECECVLLASGEYAHFNDGNKTPVREVRLAE